MLWLEERPRDTRYAGLEEMRNAARAIVESSTARVITTKGIKPNADNDRLTFGFSDIQGGIGDYDLTRWSARQLCTLTGVPFEYAAWMAKSGPVGVQLLAANLLYAAKHREDKKALAYLHWGEKKVMSFNGPDYGRVYNATVLDKIIEMKQGAEGWGYACDAAPDVRPGLIKRNYGLTMSEHDMYVFLIHKDPIRVMDRNYYRGITIWNSEVGAKSLGIAQFLYAEGCANRLVLSGVFGMAMRIIHRLSAPERFLREGAAVLTQMAESDPGPAVLALMKARDKKVAVDRKGAVDFLRANGLGKIVAESAADMGASANSGDYTTLLSLIDGVTRNSQRSGYTDQRMEEDALAGKLLEKYAA